MQKQPTTWGAKPYAAQVFDYDAHVIEQLDKVGAILIGKLSMVELAGGGDYRTAAASLTGPGLNPWDRTRWSGGSSSGPGAAVAAGLVTFAIGSETSGSILTPVRVLRRHRPAPDLWTGQPPRSDGAFVDARQTRTACAVPRKIARWCCTRSPGAITEDPGSAGRSFNYTPQYAPQTGRDHHRLHAGGFRGWRGSRRAAGVSSRSSR